MSVGWPGRCRAGSSVSTRLTQGSDLATERVRRRGGLAPAPGGIQVSRSASPSCAPEDKSLRRAESRAFKRCTRQSASRVPPSQQKDEDSNELGRRRHQMQHRTCQSSAQAVGTHTVLQVTQPLMPRAYKPHGALPTSISAGPPKAVLSAAVGHPILL